MTSVNVDVLDQLTHNLPTRRRILSGFGFGLGISLALLSFFLISNSNNNSDPFRQTYFLDSLFSSFAHTHPHSSYPSHLLNNATNPPNRTETHDPTTLETGADAGNLSFPLEVKSGAKDAPERPQTLTINATIVAAKQDLSPNPSPLAGEAAVQEQKNRTQPVDLSVEVRNVSFHGGQGIPSVGDVLPYRKVKDSVRHGNSREEKAGAGFSPRDAELLVGCDLFDGQWVKDYTKPFYPPGSCPYVDTSFNCHGNRRPDDNYLRWRWQPNNCKIPSLNATDFLERMRGKKLVFVGDSLNRNMWESLVCILRHSIRNKKRVYEISGKREFKKKGFYAFIFEDYNCTVDFVGAPFLVRPSSFRGKNGTLETLRLDLMDETTKMYLDADIVVFNTGHWWTHEKTSRGEDYYQEANYVYPKLNVLEAYEKALFTWAKWVDKHIDSTRTLVFFRGYAETHFKGGQWNSGGQCHKETEPIFNQTYLRKYNPKMKIFDRVLKGIKTPVIYLNITRLTDYRKDGHPSIYRKVYDTAQERLAAEHSQDCSHWCLPGVPDIWNELLYASLLKAHSGR